MKATFIAPLSLLVLLGITACSKKEDSTPEPAPNTGSYTVDGRATTGTAKAYYRLNTSTTGTDDQLIIVLTATPPGVATEITTLILTKALGTPESAYQVQTLNLNHGPGKPYYNYTANLTFTLIKTGTGGYSGTFSGFSPSNSPYPTSTLTQGVFTDVSL